MNNAINWFEIPVTDMPRATRFYEQTLATSLKQELFDGTPNAIFGAEGIKGALVKDGRAPTAGGPLPYLNVNGQLDAVLGRVPSAGGRVVKGRTNIGPMGAYAIVLDTEGNEIGLHEAAKR